MEPATQSKGPPIRATVRVTQDSNSLDAIGPPLKFGLWWMTVELELGNARASCGLVVGEGAKLVAHGHCQRAKLTRLRWPWKEHTGVAAQEPPLILTAQRIFFWIS